MGDSEEKGLLTKPFKLVRPGNCMLPALSTKG
jgi:hypothetical protein